MSGKTHPAHWVSLYNTGPALIQGGVVHWLFMFLYCRFKMQMVCMVSYWLHPLWLPTGTWIPPSDCSPWMQTLTNYWTTNSTTLISPKQMVRQGSDHKPNIYTFWSSKRPSAKCTFHIYPHIFLYPQKLMRHQHFWSFRTCLQEHHPRVWTDLQHCWGIWPEGPLTWGLRWSCGKVSMAIERHL